MIETIAFQLNGKSRSLRADTERKLLWVLRGDLGLTGAKYGCGEGLCGACTVVVDRAPVRSCQLTLADARGKSVTTIEGLARNGRLHPLQQRFVERGGMQCGFCTPGMIMSAYGLLLQNPSPQQGDIVRGMDGNLCRCANYRRIVVAIQDAAAAPR